MVLVCDRGKNFMSTLVFPKYVSKPIKSRSRQSSFRQTGEVAQMPAITLQYYFKTVCKQTNIIKYVALFYKVHWTNLCLLTFFHFVYDKTLVYF